MAKSWTRKGAQVPRERIKPIPVVPPPYTFSAEEIERYRVLRAQGKSRSSIQKIMKVDPARWAAFMEHLDKTLPRLAQVNLDRLRADLADKADTVHRLALQTHEKVVKGKRIETKTRTGGRAGVITEESVVIEVPNTRALDTAIKAIETKMRLYGAHVIPEMRVVINECQKAQDALVLAVADVVMPVDPDLYMKIIARVEEIMAENSRPESAINRARAIVGE